VFVGAVHYVDYEQRHIPFGNVFTPFLYKRLSFEYERELRALAVKACMSGDDAKIEETRLDFEHEGISVHVGLDELVECVFVAPTTPVWFQNLIRDVLRRYGLDRQVTRSDLEASPLY